MQIKEISRSDTLIDELECLYKDKSYIFRGQPNREFFLLPNSCRLSTIRRRAKEYPSIELYGKWRTSDEVKKIISIHDLSNSYLGLLHIARIHELTIHLLQYNHSLAKYVKSHPNNFDYLTLEEQKLRPPEFWEDENSFIHFFRSALNLSIGHITLDNKIINYSEINELRSIYDETLPQHDGIPTAAIDWTRNPYIAIFFAIQNIPEKTKQIAVYAYREIKNSPKNPILLVPGNPNCKNQRIINQEGLFTTIRYARHYYFIHGAWACIENFVPQSKENFELVKFVIDVKQINYLKKNINSQRN